MKLFKLAFLLLAVLSIASCGDDDDTGPIVCSQSDWVGVYVGTEDCSTTDAQGATITITASGTDAINFTYETEDGTTTTLTEPIVFDGCSLSVSGMESGITLTLNGSLDGDDITFNSAIDFGGVVTTCTISGTRN